jgi:hypothetical protein
VTCKLALPRSVILNAILLSAVVAFVAIPLFGWLSDIGRIVTAISFGQMIGFGVGAPWYSELFAAPLRYSGASLGFQIGAAISGRPHPLRGGDLHGLDRRRYVADLDLPDRARRHHVHRHEGCARNGRQTTELTNTRAPCATADATAKHLPPARGEFDHPRAATSAGRRRGAACPFTCGASGVTCLVHLKRHDKGLGALFL